jgi:serine phosphatase RsbU (regulator of sigma subunit)
MAFLSTKATSDSVGEMAQAIAGGARLPDRVQLGEGETTIGRHPECTVVVDAAAVSRFHAKVVGESDQFTVHDMGSRNGTFLNGEKLLAPHTLREGDRITISDIEFTFHTNEFPEFARGGSEMNFSGSSFGIVMVDEEPSSSRIVSPQVEFEKSGEGLKMRATSEAKLQALLKINRDLGNTLALDEVLPRILECLFSIFPAADRGFIVLEEEDGQLQTRWIKTRQSRDETETVRISRTIIKRVMSEREAILSFDAMEDSRFDSSESIADFSIKSMICAPLSDPEGKPFGAIQIDSTRGRGQFAEEDIDLFTGVAAQAGILITNAQMHERTLIQRSVEQDLKLATDVQKAFLPRRPPEADGFEVQSYYKAANHIGGDYFDYIHLPDGRVGIVVADVVGHGVAAAMFMAKLSAETRFCLAGEPDVARAVEKLNDRMSELEVERFITFLLMVVDPASDQVTIVNAGHMAPIVRVCQSGEIVEPGEEESGLPIAIQEGLPYEAVRVPLYAGDVAVMYTDGINEAMDGGDNEFGIDAIRTLAAGGGNCEQIKDRIVEAVLKHVGNAPPFDDMCLVVIERTRAPGDVGAEATSSTSDTVDEDIIDSSLL